MQVNSITSFKQNTNKMEVQESAYDRALNEQLLNMLDKFATGEADCVVINSSTDKKGNVTTESVVYSKLEVPPVEIKPDENPKKKNIFSKLIDKFRK